MPNTQLFQRSKDKHFARCQFNPRTLIAGRLLSAAGEEGRGRGDRRCWSREDYVGKEEEGRKEKGGGIQGGGGEWVEVLAGGKIM